jgi:hypothetical protein
MLMLALCCRSVEEVDSDADVMALMQRTKEVEG